MSDSGLKLPTTTELEGRVREALKVARRVRWAVLKDFDAAVRADRLETNLDDIIRILEDGRS